MSDESVQNILLYEIRELRKEVKTLHAKVDTVQRRMVFRMALLGVAGGSLPPSILKVLGLLNIN